jgi:glycosyltransferase involved in cell wall biosynthesis
MRSLQGVRAAEKAPHIALVLIGDGVLRASLEELARQLGIDRRVHFFGETSDPSDVYREFDAFFYRRWPRAPP